MSELIVEFIGTFLTTLPVPLASFFVGPLAALPIGFMLASMIYSFLFISGAHFNPSITFAMFISQRLPLQRSVLFMLVQFVAAFLACIYAAYGIGVDVVAPQTASVVAAWKALSTEMAFCAAIVTVYMHTCCSRQKGNQYYGFAIGFAFLSAVLCVPGGFNGSAFNPAVATSLQLTRCIVHQDCKPLIAFWVHWLAPFIGAAFGVFCFGILDTDEKVPEVDPKQVAAAAADAQTANFY